MSDDGLDFVCQNTILRCGQVNSELCIFAHVVNEFDDSPSSISLCL